MSVNWIGSELNENWMYWIYGKIENKSLNWTGNELDQIGQKIENEIEKICFEFCYNQKCLFLLF